MYKFVSFVINHIFTDARGYSEWDRKQSAIAVVIAPFTTILIVILAMSLLLWNDIERVKEARLKNPQNFVQATLDSNGLISISIFYYSKSGTNTMNVTEKRSQFKVSDDQIVWKIQRRVYDATDRPIYSNDYIEGTPKTQINGYRMEYDKNGRLIKKEQLQGLVIELEKGGSYVESIGTVVISPPAQPK
jgi:hypothetical protein